VYKRHDPCILYVDDCFGHTELVKALREVHFVVVGHHEQYDNRQSVKDEEIIPLCASNKWLIATTDKNMILRHRGLLVRHRQSVIFTTNCNDDNLTVWVPGFEKNKAKIDRTWKKREPPWVGRLHPGGHLEIFDLIRYTESQAETVRKRRK